MINFPVIENPIIKQNKRFGQTNILPFSVKNRNLGDIVLESGTASGSADLSNGEQVVFTITTSVQNDSRIFCVPDISLYQGSVDDANLIPSGASVTSTQWQVVFMSNDWAATDTYNVITRVFVRNISAGASTTVLIRTVSRVITNTAL